MVNPVGAAWIKCLQYSTGAYTDTSQVGYGFNAFLPNIIQCGVQALLGIPFDQKSYQDLSYFSSDNAFLPRTIQCQVQSQLGVPYDPRPAALGYTTWASLAQNSPPIPGTPFKAGTNYSVNAAPFNAGLTRPGDLGYNLAVYSAQVVQAPFFNQWWASYSPQAFGLGYTSWASLAQNPPPIPGTPVKAGADYSVDAAPYNPQAFAPGITWFNIQTQAPVGPSPFFNNLYYTATVAPYNTQSYRDLTGPADWNAFLPVQIQAPIASYGTVSLTWAPYNTGDYRDRTYDASKNAFLPNIIQGPVSSLLGIPFDPKAYLDLSYFNSDNAFLPNVIQCGVQSYLGAPFDTRSYRDLHIFFNPVALNPVPINRPTPVVPFDPQRFSQTPLVNNLIYGLSAPVLPPATRLNFIENITPFNSIAFRDLSLQFNINLNPPFSLVANPLYIGTYPGPYYVIGGPNITRKL